MTCKIYRYGTQFYLCAYKPTFVKTNSNNDVPNSNDFKLANNLSRARSRVRELAHCNNWEYFVTLTLDAEKVDRFDLDGSFKRISQFIRNYNKQHSCCIKYLIIPEQHKNGAWHFHGLMTGFPAKAFCKNANGYLDWIDYSKRFGYISLSPVRDPVKCANYISKYVTKSTGDNIDIGHHSYYCSRGLNGKEELQTIYVDDEYIKERMFECEYVFLDTCNEDELFNYFQHIEENGGD